MYANVSLQNSFHFLLDGNHIAAGDGYGIVAVLHDKLHGAGLRNKMLHLPKVNDESAMTAYYHGIGMQRVFHLFRCGAEHI